MSFPGNPLGSSIPGLELGNTPAPGILAGPGAPAFALINISNTFTQTQTILVAGGGLGLAVTGGGALTGPAITINDSTTGKRLFSITNIAGDVGGIATSLNFMASNAPVAQPGGTAWIMAVDQSAPTPNRDFVGAGKVIDQQVSVTTTLNSPNIIGVFDPADVGLNVSSPNIPATTIQQVVDGTHATLTSGVGVAAGTANARFNGTKDLEYWANQGRAAAQLGLLPAAYNAGVWPSPASVHIAGPFSISTQPQQLELLTGGPAARQVAPAFGIRQTGDANPTWITGMSGGAAANPLQPYFAMGVGAATVPNLFFGLTSPGPAFTVQRTAAGVQQLLTLQNPNGASADGIRQAFNADTFIIAAIDATNTNHGTGLASVSFKVGTGGGVGTIAERLRIDGNGVAFNGSAPFFPNATPANAVAPANTGSVNAAVWGYSSQVQADAIVAAVIACVTAINFWNNNLKAYGLST